MSETDVLKMKVADLKRELKLRGLSSVGNKVELQERLQTALLDGDFSLEDTAISEELLDEDVLTDEDEKAVLESPQEEKVLLQETIEKMEEKQSSSNESNNQQSKKVILKRKNSVLSASSTTNASAPLTTNSNSSSILNQVTGSAGGTNEKSTPPEKILKLQDSIETAEANDKNDDKTNADSKKVVKLSELSMKERLEMRAKKFGISAKDSTGKTMETPIKSEKETKLIEALKKRAERFGCVLSSKIADIEKQEKLQKRQERFGIAGANNNNGASAAVATTNQTKDIYAEKARLRLERFKAK